MSSERYGLFYVRENAPDAEEELCETYPDRESAEADFPWHWNHVCMKGGALGFVIATIAPVDGMGAVIGPGEGGSAGYFGRDLDGKGTR